MSKGKGKLFIVSAPSGAGKTTLCDQLLDEFADSITLSISCTTRPPRINEQNGVDYHFLSQDEFKARIQKGEFAEWAVVHGNYYGTCKSTIKGTLDQGKSVLLDIDVQGAKSLSESFGNRCVMIFISPPSMEVLERRLRSRGTESEAAIQQRIHNAHKELQQADLFQYKILNDQFDDAYAQLKNIVTRELSQDPDEK